MQMQDGIGRGGYRVLAFVGFAVGALGLIVAAVALVPSGFFEWLGLGLAALALGALTGLVLATLGLPAERPRPAWTGPAAAPDSGVVPLPTPQPPAAPDPAADVGFDYPDVEPLEPSVMAGARMSAVDQPAPPRAPQRLSTPPPMGRPPPRSAPPAGREDPNDSTWPDRKPKSGVTRRQVSERSGAGLPSSGRGLPRDPGPDIEIEGPGRLRREPPVVMARTVASAEASGIPEGSSVGKCGNCGVLLLAPKKRPIRLQCPRCERVHTLA